LKKFRGRTPDLISSGVVEGERGGTPFPRLFLRGNAVPPNRIGARGNADTVTFPLIKDQKCILYEWSTIVTIKKLNQVKNITIIYVFSPCMII
jgi:hypothetical protein